MRPQTHSLLLAPSILRGLPTQNMEDFKIFPAAVDCNASQTLQHEQVY